MRTTPDAYIEHEQAFPDHGYGEPETPDLYECETCGRQFEYLRDHECMDCQIQWLARRQLTVGVKYTIIQTGNFPSLLQSSEDSRR